VGEKKKNKKKKKKEKKNFSFFVQKSGIKQPQKPKRPTTKKKTPKTEK